MTRNLKSLGLALVAVLALGAFVAQAASAHEFHQAKERAVLTGANVGAHTFKVGSAGTVTCANATFEGTKKAVEGSDSTWNSDEVTVRPEYKECEFGGQPATVKVNHCAYIFDSDTTVGNTTGGEHAFIKVQCAEGNKIEIVTSICTLWVEEQTVADAVRYFNEETATKTTTVEATAHGVNVNHSGAGGCVLVPKGKVGVYTGKATNKCYEDLSEVTGTNLTTPGNFVENNQISCTVSGAPTGE